MITKPMLAGKAPADTALLSYPVLCSPKLDGIRCLTINGKAVSRTFKPIPNKHIREAVEDLGIDNLDGEILVRGRTFNELSGDVRREDGKPDFYLAVFDHVGFGFGGLSEPYESRMKRLARLDLSPCCLKILPVQIGSPEALLQFEEKCIAEGYEGVMTRTPGSPYKCGRSSTKEEYLLKVKRFEDDEAVVIGVEEMMENQNVATRDAFGRTERSSHKENMVPKGTMGKLVVLWENDRKQRIQFEIGTGYDAATRQAIWNKRAEVIGQTVKFKHQPSGADEKPRFPVFLGFRDKWDM